MRFSTYSGKRAGSWYAVANKSRADSLIVEEECLSRPNSNSGSSEPSDTLRVVPLNVSKETSSGKSGYKTEIHTKMLFLKARLAALEDQKAEAYISVLH